MTIDSELGKGTTVTVTLPLDMTKDAPEGDDPSEDLIVPIEPRLTKEDAGPQANRAHKVA